MTFDFRLLDISIEIYALKSHFDTIEKQIDYIETHDREIVEKTIEEEELNSDTPEWHELVQEYEHKVHVELPRFFRNPFLVSLYSTYETAIIEIAGKIQKKKELKLSIKDINARSFLEQAKKYYKHVLDFPLFEDNNNWAKIRVLSDLRNAISHTNGRLDLIKEGLRNDIKSHSNNGYSISFTANYMLVEKELAEELLNAVVDSLEKLVARYKSWDTSQKPT